MAISYVRYTGTGAQTNFSITFPYLDEDHVEVRVNGSSVSFTWVNSTTVAISPAPANGAIVELRRNTPSLTPIVEWQDGAIVSEEQLAENTKQSLYISQEAEDSSDDALSLDSTGTWDAVTKRIKNVTNPTSDQDAATKAYVDNQVGEEYAEAAEASAVAAEAAKVAAEAAKDVIVSVVPEVTIAGSIPNDPTKAVQNSAKWQEAFNQVAPYGGRVILSNGGVHYLDGNPSQVSGAPVTLVLRQGATWASGAPVVSAVVAEGTPYMNVRRFHSEDTTADEYNVVGEALEVAQYGIGGHYGRRMNYQVHGAHNSPIFDIADSVQSVWHDVNGGFCLTRWDVAVGPKNNGGADEGFAVYSYENNPVNRYGDEGYSRTRTTEMRWAGGFQHVPENQDFLGTGDGNLGYHVLFGFLVGHSPFENTEGDYSKTYNAFMTEADSIAPAGVWGLAQGNTGSSGDDPKAVVDMVYTWKMGIDFRDATFRDSVLGNNAAMRLDTEHYISWRRISDDLDCLIFGNSFDRFYMNALSATEGIQFGTPNLGATMARIYSAVASPDDYLSLVAGDFNTELRAEGTNTNVYLTLKPKGSGNVILNYSNVPQYANEAAAHSAGLPQGAVYRNSTDNLMIKVTP